jgi:Sulfotransferase domain
VIATGLALAGVAVAVVIALDRYLLWYLRWESKHTGGMTYYGKPAVERRALKRRIRLYSAPVKPVVHLMALANRHRLAMPVFEYEGVCGPPKVSSAEIFARAKNYRPRREDVFVATQMRCGTTWMQQVVFQTVMRGRGDLSDKGYGHLYALSPWIDAVTSISVEDAPLVGDKPTRIVKTHLPTALCPYSPDAKYIYVTRHPVSCFASIVDYNRSLLGPLMPPVAVLADWFCSDRMYWLPWPRHVAGWWQWAQQRENVLFLHFEEMIGDFPGARNRVERFLGDALTADEHQLVTEKCSFRYMKDHEELFEMAPPTMFSVTGGEYLKSGKASRDQDVSPELRERILDYCRRALRGAEYPVARFYPDLAER